MAKVSGAKPSANNMPKSEHDVKDLLKVLWAKAEGINSQACLDHSNMARASQPGVAVGRCCGWMVLDYTSTFSALGALEAIHWHRSHPSGIHHG